MALHLVRHGDAGTAPDEERPLTEGGRRQAAWLADHLASWPVTRVLSSRYHRCLETVTPLADRLDLPIEHHRALAEEADVEDAWALLESLVAEEAVLCSHWNIISPILDRVLRSGADIVADEWTCRKGSVWRLEPEGGRPFGRATLDLLA
jgi:8-oxo-dGTP diphosphatase